MYHIFTTGFTDNYWIALTNLGNEQFYWFGYKKPAKFTNWSWEGRPGRSEGSCTAISGSDAVWMAKSCDSLSYFICESDVLQWAYMAFEIALTNCERDIQSKIVTSVVIPQIFMKNPLWTLNFSMWIIKVRNCLWIIVFICVLTPLAFGSICQHHTLVPKFPSRYL